MAVTNFAGLTSDEKLVWSRDVWSAARDAMFITKFSGSKATSMIHMIDELTKTEKGAEAIMFLVADMVGDGIVGDNEREGNEEDLVSYSQKIAIDLISHGTKNKGKMADQKTCINFREQSKDKLGYWLGNRLDQLAFLTMSGVSYAYKNNGAIRAGSQFPSLAFAGDVSAPSSKRHVNWTGSALTAGDTSTVTASYLPTYKMLVQLKAFAKDHYIKPLIADGKEYYVLLCRPGTIAQLKMDDNYIKAVTTAHPRSEKNPFFTGGTVTLDGIVLHEHNLVFNTTGADSGSKWGSSGTVEGTRSLLCGQQALGFCKLGTPTWVEEGFDYKSKQGINVDQMFGFVKPKYPSIYEADTTTEQDFGLVAVDHALPFV